MKQFKTILHPTDFSECSQAALELAGSLAQEQGARLIILHVAHTPIVAAADGLLLGAPPIDLAPIEEQLLLVQPPQTGVVVTHRLVEGDIVDEILHTASNTQADVIVLGSHGRTGFGRVLMGSVAERIVRKANCTVVVAKPSVTASKSSNADLLEHTSI